MKRFNNHVSPFQPSLKRFPLRSKNLYQFIEEVQKFDPSYVDNVFGNNTNRITLKSKDLPSSSNLNRFKSFLTSLSFAKLSQNPLFDKVYKLWSKSKIAVKPTETGIPKPIQNKIVETQMETAPEVIDTETFEDLTKDTQTKYKLAKLAQETQKDSIDEVEESKIFQEIQKYVEEQDSAPRKEDDDDDDDDEEDISISTEKKKPKHNNTIVEFFNQADEELEDLQTTKNLERLPTDMRKMFIDTYKEYVKYYKNSINELGATLRDLGYPDPVILKALISELEHRNKSTIQQFVNPQNAVKKFILSVKDDYSSPEDLRRQFLNRLGWDDLMRYTKQMGDKSNFTPFEELERIINTDPSYKEQQFNFAIRNRDKVITGDGKIVRKRNRKKYRK